jgi:hypothetical protein
MRRNIETIRAKPNATLERMTGHPLAHLVEELHLFFAQRLRSATGQQARWL